MYEVFQILKSAGKHIYATSNMYIPKEKMRVLLAKCGYEGFEDILVSCDYHCGKGNGALFRVLQSKVKSDNTIVHIGDNVGADIKGAQAAGIDAKYYMACRNLGDPQRGAGMSPLIGSAYRGVINTRLHNGMETFSEFWEYGYIYGGLIVLGYVNWLHEQAVQNGITKILFLSRDGFILKKVFDALFDDISSEYVFWSRISALRNVCDSERNPFLERIIGERCGSGDTIRTAFEVAGIENLLDQLEENGLSPDMPLLAENKAFIIDFLVSHWDLVKKELEVHQKSTSAYLQELVGNEDRISIVDIGWSGRNLITLVKALNQVGLKSEKISLYMIGSIYKNQNITQILSNNLQCYMFDVCKNRNIHDRFCKQSAFGLEAIEKIFSASHSSFIGFENGTKMEFAAPEIDNYFAFQEIERGAMEFCRDYYLAFQQYPYLNNIGGYDAYIPIRFLFDNPDALYRVIGNLTYVKGISLNDRHKINNLREKR